MDRVKFTFTNPFAFRALLWSKLPLAAFAGLRVMRLDERGAEVKLPAGWKTQNPFGSTYFAAQAMAEGKTGAERSDGIASLEGRFTVYRATYRHTVKGPDRGAWTVEVTAEADAPLEAVFAVVRGVQRRSAVAAEPDKLTGDEFRAIVGATESV